jgi:NADPH2:quinone reductase
MKAIRVREFGGPEVLRVEDAPDPKPGPGEVVVQVHAIGVNPVDTYIRSGKHGQRPALPYTPGSDAAGVVEAAGEGVTGVRRGDRVYVGGTTSPGYTGACAEKVLCRASQVHPLPAGLTFAQGAAVFVPYATAHRALFHRARAVPGETVLVHGASGGVGVASVQLARANGLRVIGSSGTERGRSLVRELGADHVVDHSDPTYLDRVRELTGGRGVDVILEMLANVNLGKDLGILAPRGRVAVIGCRGTVEVNPREAMARDLDILGVALANAPEPELAAIHAALGTGLANGTLRPVVGREFPLKDAPRAHEAVLAPGSHGKIVLLP